MSADKYTCPKCQNEVSYGDKFCGKCGFQFGDWGGVSTVAQTGTNTASQQPITQTPPVESSGGSFFGKLVKWAIIIVLAIVAFCVVSSFFEVASPKEAIKNGDEKAMAAFYKKAKDKEKAKTEMGSAFLKEAYRILEEEEFKKSSGKQLDAQNKLLRITETFAMNDELQELGKLRSAFSDIAVANSQFKDAEDILWKKYNVTPNTNIRRIDGYVLNKIQNSDSQYQCVSYEYLFGQAVPKDPICVLDFKNYEYVKQGVQVVYGVRDKEADFEDRAGFKTKMTIYKVVDEGVFTEFGNVKQMRAAKRIKEDNFKRAYPKDYFANGTSVTQANTGTSSAVSSNNMTVQPITDNAINGTNQSSFDNEDGYHHDASKAIDGDIKSCWAEGVQGLGIGEFIQVNFNGTYKVSGLNIWAGHQKSQDLYYKNARPVAIRVIGSNGSNAVYPLEDRMGMQRVNFISPINVSNIKIVVEKVAPGNKYEDTCIGEISFF